MMKGVRRWSRCAGIVVGGTPFPWNLLDEAAAALPAALSNH